MASPPRCSLESIRRFAVDDDLFDDEWNTPFFANPAAEIAPRTSVGIQAMIDVNGNNVLMQRSYDMKEHYGIDTAREPDSNGIPLSDVPPKTCSSRQPDPINELRFL
jgi:hypothetical protein